MKIWNKNGLSIAMPKLRIEATDDFEGRRRKWKLIVPFGITIISNGMRQEVIVPAGFETDFATLPIFTQIVLGNRDDRVYSAVLHDWLCETKVPRWIANSFMRSALLVLGCPWWKRILFFWGLMLFGYGSRPSKLFSKMKGKIDQWTRMTT